MAEWNKEQNSAGQRNAMQDPAREPHMDQQGGKEQAEYSPPMQSDFLRETIPFVDNDRYLYPDMEYIFDRVQDCSLIDILEKELGELEF